MSNLAGNELAREVTRHLGGKWHGSYGTARGPGHGKHDASLTIKAHRTNPNDVVIKSFAGDDWQQIKDELRREGILPKWDSKSSQPVDMVAAKAARERAEKEERQEANRKRQSARRLYQQALPAKGTEAENYLLHRLRNLPPHLNGELPLDTIRYLPAGLAGVYPAMIAPFAWPVSEPEPGRLSVNDADVDGVHLTFLKEARKAPIPNAKQMRATCKGKPIVLAPPNDGLALCIAEGIETALYSHFRQRGIGAWAAGSSNFMPALAHLVPGWVEVVWLEMEEDAASKRDAMQLAELLLNRGFEVNLVGGGK